MSYSLNEVQALAKRASRGAGYSWGLAEEAGVAVRWLSYFGLDGPLQLAMLLSAVDGRDLSGFRPTSLTGPWEGSSDSMCALASGATLSDCAQRIKNEDDIVLHNVLNPALLSAFAGHVARQIGAPVELTWDQSRIVTDGHNLSVEGLDEAQTTAAAVTCRKSASKIDGLPHLRRAEITPDTLKQLNAFAHRTYVPATEESRIRGAG